MEQRSLSRRQALRFTAAAALLRPAGTSEYPLYRARGSHRELGRQHGEQAAGQIRAHVEIMCAGQKISRDALRNLAARFDPIFSRYCPHLLDEMRGLAEGAGIAFAEAMACNIRGELRGGRPQGCTSYAIGPGGSARREVLAGQNCDIAPDVVPLAYMLHLQPEGKPEVLMWTFGGMLGYHGMNSAGVAHFSNALGGGPSSRFGIPEYPIERMMLECRNVEQVIGVLRKMPLASNENFMVCDSQGNIADVEATAAGPEILYDRGAGFLVHTNHFLCRRYATAANFRQSLPDSFPRLDRMESLVRSHYGSIEVDDMKRILSDHSGAPAAICRHGRGMRTVASLIAEPVSRRMHVARGNPCEQRYATYSI